MPLLEIFVILKRAEIPSWTSEKEYQFISLTKWSFTNASIMTSLLRHVALNLGHYMAVLSSLQVPCITRKIFDSPLWNPISFSSKSHPLIPYWCPAFLFFSIYSVVSFCSLSMFSWLALISSLSALICVSEPKSSQSSCFTGISDDEGWMGATYSSFTVAGKFSLPFALSVLLVLQRLGFVGIDLCLTIFMVCRRKRR